LLQAKHRNACLNFGRKLDGLPGFNFYIIDLNGTTLSTPDKFFNSPPPFSGLCRAYRKTEIFTTDLP
jgi:hypothetical protein